LSDIQEVFDRFRQAGLKLNPKKCSFAQSSVIILGHHISKDGIRPPPDRVKALSEFPIPKNTKQLRRALGMFNWFRKYINNYSSIVEPLTRLLRKNVNFMWTIEQEMSFKRLKNSLMNSEILSFPRFDLPFVLAVDSSSTGIGYILYQRNIDNSDDKVQIIRFGSKSLNTWQKSYGPTKLELLGVVTSIIDCASYLRGNKFTVECDHQALKPLFQNKLRGAIYDRWLAVLQQFNFDIKYKPAAQKISFLNYVQFNSDDIDHGYIADTEAESDLKSVTKNLSRNDSISTPCNIVEHDLIDVSGNNGISTLTCNIVEHDLIDLSGKNSISTITCNIADNDFIDVGGDNSISTLTCNTVEHDLIDVSGKNSISTPTGNIAEHGFIDISGENSFSTHTCGKAEHDLLDISGNENKGDLLNLTGDDRKHDLLDPNGKGNKHDLIDLSGNDSISELSCNIAEYDLIDHSGNDSISTISDTIADNDLINLSVKDSISTPTCDLIESTGEFQQINEFEHVCLAAGL
jgi:hypothetical protein